MYSAFLMRCILKIAPSWDNRHPPDGFGLCAVVPHAGVPWFIRGHRPVSSLPLPQAAHSEDPGAHTSFPVFTSVSMGELPRSQVAETK